MTDLFSGNGFEYIRHGASLYLFKMRPDGSRKTEVNKFWKNPNYPVNTPGDCGWMNVTSKSRKIALSTLFAGSDEAKLWMMNFDSTDFKRIITPTLTAEALAKAGKDSTSSRRPLASATAPFEPPRFAPVPPL